MQIRNAHLCFFALVLSFLLGCQGQSPRKDPAKDRKISQEVPALKPGVQELLQVKKKEAETLAAEGEMLLRQGKLDLAAGKWRAAIEAYPPLTKPYVMLIDLFVHLQEYDEAIKVLEDSGAKTNEYPLLYLYAFGREWGQVPIPAAKERIFIAQFKDNKQAAVSFMFCDGARTVYINALPLFDKYDFKATIAIIPGRVHEKAESTELSIRGSWGEWQDAHKRGFEICNHTLNHTPLKGIAGKELDAEVNESYDLMAQRIAPPPCFLFPDYAQDAESIKRVKERHTFIVSHEYLSGIYSNVFLPYYGGSGFTSAVAEKLLDFAIQRQLWVVPICHGVRKEEKFNMHRPITTEFLEAHLGDIKKREDRLWVDTINNVYLYLLERKNTQIQAQEFKKDGAKFEMTTSLTPSVYSVPLTVVVDVFPAEPKDASAFAEEGKQPLPVKIHGSQVILDVPAHSSRITVEWK